MAERMDKAYSVIQIKEINEDLRVIRGVATTPSVDRVGDIIDPMGVRVANDIPLFLYHDSTKTVGRAKLGKADKSGIPFEASIPHVKEAGALRDRVDEAWQMLKYRLITGVSIGFNVINEKFERMKEGGYKFLETEVLELSLVPIPANQDATITAIKSIAASGIRGNVAKPPGVTGKSAARQFRNKGDIVKTLQELRDERNTKNARLGELVELLKAEDRDSTDEEAEEFDAVSSEVKKLDDQIRVKQFDALNSASAKSVDGSSSNGASRSRSPNIIVRNTDPDDAFAGQSYIRGVIARAASFVSMKSGNFVSPGEVAAYRWGKSHPVLVKYIAQQAKAGVAGGGTGSGEWGAELAQSDARFTGDFITFLYSMTVFDKLALRAVPARVHIKGQDGAATGYWVGESKAIPVSKPDFSSVELTPLKVAAMAACSKELVLDSSPAAEVWIRDSIAEASAQRIDTTFLSTTAASAGVSPAGILNGLTGLLSSGVDGDAVRADIKTLYRPFISAKNASNLTLVMHPAQAKAIQLLVNALGQAEFPNITATGGTLLGDTVVTGENVGANDIILLKANDIWKIGDGGVQIDMSDQATIEQDSAPAGAGDTPTAASATLMSLWQTDQVGFKVTRRVNFQKRRTSAVAYITDADYDTVES